MLLNNTNGKSVEVLQSVPALPKLPLRSKDRLKGNTMMVVARTKSKKPNKTHDEEEPFMIIKGLTKPPVTDSGAET